jgi:hypothetical protein
VSWSGYQSHSGRLLVCRCELESVWEYRCESACASAFAWLSGCELVCWLLLARRWGCLLKSVLTSEYW